MCRWERVKHKQILHINHKKQMEMSAMAVRPILTQTDSQTTERIMLGQHFSDILITHQKSNHARAQNISAAGLTGTRRI